MVFGRILLIPVLVYLALASFVKVKNNDLPVHAVAEYGFIAIALALLALLMVIRVVRHRKDYRLEGILREHRRRRSSPPRFRMALVMVAAIMIPVIYVIVALVKG